MAQQVELEVARREVLGKKTKRLRKEGIIPANIFGHKETPEAIQIDAAAFDRFRRANRLTSLLSLRIPGSTAAQTVLVRHIQHHPCTDRILHIDFFRVSMDESVHVKTTLHFVGESPAVKNENGVLLHLMDALEVECRASDILEYLDIDISSLAEIDATLHASDVVLPANVTLITNPDEAIAKVVASRAEKDVEEATAEAAPAEAAPAADAEASTGA
ncbi:MAG: 50S ribosomal protein L25 [Ktedonobacteraceae bacterium]|nr:50S ribosomal protein L25 [Ktedonobacteraceae bacterium]